MHSGAIKGVKARRSKHFPVIQNSKEAGTYNPKEKKNKTNKDNSSLSDKLKPVFENGDIKILNLVPLK